MARRPQYTFTEIESGDIWKPATFQTRLHTRVARVPCAEHWILLIRVPWGEPGSLFTMLFERVVIDWAQDAAVAAVSRRAVRHGLRTRELGRLTWLSVGEKSFLRRHNYVTIVTDLEEPRVLFVADDRKQESVVASGPWDWAFLIEAIATDMWEPYVQPTLARIPGAKEKLVFDKFHVAKHLNEAVDRVRRAEHRELLAREGRTSGRDEVHFATKSRVLCRRSLESFRSAAPEQSQGRPSVGAQADHHVALGLQLRRRRAQSLPPLVLLADPISP